MTYVEMKLFVSLKAFCCTLELFQAKKKKKITLKCSVINDVIKPNHTCPQSYRFPCRSTMIVQ